MLQWLLRMKYKPNSNFTYMTNKDNSSIPLLKSIGLIQIRVTNQQNQLPYS